MLTKPGACHSPPPLLVESPFRTFCQTFQPQTHVEMFDEMRTARVRIFECVIYRSFFFEALFCIQAVGHKSSVS
jgi:hypothetical protein